MEYEIVRMEAAHVPQIAALERSAFPDPWSESSVASDLDNPLSLWLVAQAGGEVLVYVISQSVMGEADMMNLAVLPAARRRGIARALVTALIRELAGGGVHSLTLEVRASNYGAIALYGSRGFRSVGRRKNYYEHPKEDAIIMTKEFTDGTEDPDTGAAADGL